MKKVIIIFIALSCCLSFSTTEAVIAISDMVRCGDRIVQKGESKSEVIADCGNPISTEKNGSYERWHIDIGANYFIRVITFNNDRVVELYEDTSRMGSGRQNQIRNSSTAKTDSPIAGYRSVIRIVDGDTIVLDGNEKVRLIGVNTPESVHPSKPVEYFSKEATEFIRSMVEGKRVKVEYDWQRTDKYGRTLAYVYLEGGTFVNLEIVRQGYGFAYTKYPFKYMEEFRQAERQARENNSGLHGVSNILETEKVTKLPKEAQKESTYIPSSDGEAWIEYPDGTRKRIYP